MANQEHLDILKQGVDIWNQWRNEPNNIEVEIWLEDAHLEGAHLEGAHLQWAWVQRAHLEGANLSRASLAYALLSGVNLTKAHLEGADLRGADLRGVNLTKAHLEGADLRGADLTKAHLSDADLSGANLSGRIFSRYLFERTDPRRVDRAFNHKHDEKRSHEGNIEKNDLGPRDLASINLSGANLSGANLSNASLDAIDFSDADLSGTNLSNTNLSRTNLTKAHLVKAHFSRANLSNQDLGGANLAGTNLSGANLSGANLTKTNLSGANLSDANLNRTLLIETKLTHAVLTQCSIYGIAAWKIDLEETTQKDLIITPEDEPIITVDNLKLAQFIYLLLDNAEIRDAIDTIARKAVLILGRFTIPLRKAVLDALRDTLRTHGYLPIVFDFDKPTSRDLTETISTLAHLARFIIVDLTDPRSAPHEVATVIPYTIVPVQPLLWREPLVVDEKAVERREYALFQDLRRRYHWVLPTLYYTDQGHLLAILKEHIIEPAERKAQELEKR